MLIGFLLIFMTNTKIIYSQNFIAPLKQCPISMMPSTISSGESCCKLLAPHKMMVLFKEEEISKFCTHHKTFCTLSPPIPQLSASIVKEVITYLVATM